MRGFARFLGKEATEVLRTWRIWVLPGVFLFFALSGPILAKLTPQLVASLGTGQSGVIIKIPEPTYLDAYAQWIKNLAQIGVFLLIGVTAGLVAGEAASGTAALVLTKPVSRSGFVVAKYLVHAALLSTVTVLGTLLTWGITVAVFTEAPPSRLFAGSALWLVFGLLILAVSVFWSSAFSTLAALGASVATFVVLSLLTLWGPTAHYTPAGLIGAPSAALAGTEPEVMWPLATAALAVTLLVWAATRVFAHREI
jgi:ABC-2 type transport system permease protein